MYFVMLSGRGSPLPGLRRRYVISYITWSFYLRSKSRNFIWKRREEKKHTSQPANINALPVVFHAQCVPGAICKEIVLPFYSQTTHLLGHTGLCHLKRSLRISFMKQCFPHTTSNFASSTETLYIPLDKHQELHSQLAVSTSTDNLEDV